MSACDTLGDAGIGVRGGAIVHRHQQHHLVRPYPSPQHPRGQRGREGAMHAKAAPGPGGGGGKAAGKSGGAVAVVPDARAKQVLKEAVDAVVNSFAKHTQGYGRGECDSDLFLRPLVSLRGGAWATHCFRRESTPAPRSMPSLRLQQPAGFINTSLSANRCQSCVYI
ncbi:hypothetical protein J437_LFUL006916 [Ladona fulva]|uniref:Uncharacterized protein n=1 Tax=Ladona fulva TaxID=123851 RepID=A0A8K0K2B0_LADFU|nr:hypothetical protein J437_LFUL006916 [Ladona fulva]